MLRPRFSQLKSSRPHSSWSHIVTGRSGPQYFGLGSHLGQPGYGAPVTNATKLEQFNCKVWRDDIQWAFDEPTPGVHTFIPSSSHQPFADIFSALASHASRGYDIFFAPVMIHHTDAYTTDFTNATWRASFVAFCVHCAQQYLIAGRPANRLILTIGNQPNEPTMGEYGIDKDDGLGVRNYGELCKEVRAAIQAINPAIRIQVAEGINGSHASYATWRDNFLTTPNFLASGFDIWSTNEFQEPFLTYGPPEALYANMHPVFADVVKRAENAGRVITTAMSSGGYPVGDPGSPTEEQWFSRMPFLYSVLPAFEFCSFYSMRDNLDGFQFTAEGTFIDRPKAAVVTDAFRHLHFARERAMYQDGGATAIKMAGATGEQRLVLWHATSGVSPITVRAAASGTLLVDTPGAGTTSTAIVAGDQTVNISVNETSKILYSTTPVIFPQFGAT